MPECAAHQHGSTAVQGEAGLLQPGDGEPFKRRLSKDHTAVNTGALAGAIGPQISVERSVGRAA